MSALIYKIPKPANVLLVEDNAAEIVLVLEAFKSSSNPIRIIPVLDVPEAMEYLKGRGCYLDAERPDLVLLDLGLPGKGGLELLAEMKVDSSLKEIPVVILTQSNLEEDIQDAYRAGANFYQVKPPDYEGYFEAARRVEALWLANLQAEDD